MKGQGQIRPVLFTLQNQIKILYQVRLHQNVTSSSQVIGHFLLRSNVSESIITCISVKLNRILIGSIFKFFCRQTHIHKDRHWWKQCPASPFCWRADCVLLHHINNCSHKAQWGSLLRPLRPHSCYSYFSVSIFHPHRSTNSHTPVHCNVLHNLLNRRLDKWTCGVRARRSSLLRISLRSS